ncbi:helix-turn-helix domain-containing protein [Microvirga antarctica]|uniref:helix-turn-helix domain-containing protein n=1 Tax=Microvirga antarctica TaxID=2819233 RepID=UPI003CCECF04
MALAALQSECRGKVDGERLADGFHRAAHLFIERECSDPHLTPDSVVLSLGCSRASLYRVFLRHGESISAAIWEARLSRALLLLGSSSNRHLSIAEIAFRSGFVEQTSFSRMFKRRFSVTPRDAREHRALHAPREDHRSSSQGQAKIENVVRTTSGLRQR